MVRLSFGIRQNGLPARVAPNRFQGITPTQAEQLEWAEKASLMTPRELLTALDAMLKKDYQEAYAEHKNWVTVQTGGRKEHTVAEIKRALHYNRAQMTESTIPYTICEKTLIAKLTAEAYMGKGDNTAAELKAYLTSLEYYDASQPCVDALVQKFILESNKNTLMMP